MSLKRAKKFLTELVKLLGGVLFQDFRDAVLLAIEIITFIELCRVNDPESVPKLFHGETEDEPADPNQ